ncbi:hypothetical protein TWF730_008068 [Orbilia blumenaviensis]|uniref:F-box domain-containing protein n=1 Tax=Orbilia blumenaviensis TaxID=1796055 RepID=A0AAV9VCW0_9PEZI
MNQSGSLLLRLPVEVQIGILQSCGSFKQALSLIATCKQLRLLWETYSTSIVSYIGRNAIPAFDDALMAVRATEHAAKYYTHIVHVAYGLPTASPPPPSTISINTLGAATAGKASVTEAKKVFDLKLFVDYSFYLSHHPTTATHLACLTQWSTYIPLPWACEYQREERGSICHVRKDGMRINTRSTNYNDEEARIEGLVYAGMYNFFTLSALLTNRYYEPFFTENPISTRLRNGYEIFWPREIYSDPSIASRAVLNPDGGDGDGGGSMEIDENEARIREYYQPLRQLADDEVEYLMQWDVFNKVKFREARQGGLAEAFDEIAGYFCERARRRAKNSTPEQYSIFGAEKENDRLPQRRSYPTPTFGYDTEEDEEEEGEREREREEDKEYLFDTATAAEIQQMMILNNCYEVWMRMRERIDSLLEPVRLTHEKLLYALSRDNINLTTIPVVFHAIYGVGDAMMPSTIEDFRTHSYGPVPPNLQGNDKNGQPLKHTEVSDVIYQLINKVGQELGAPGPGEDGGDAGRRYFEFGWSEYAFWEWVMKKRFGMRINWKWVYVDSRYYDFVRNGRAFGGVEQFRREIPGVVIRRLGESGGLSEEYRSMEAG